ncbi:histidinol phosphate phosphatase domain-containing protein [Methanonatronarchaeum sp. AMET-Sl]|uniref:histidinol phosphate phosphatase domain-containing protein n=1 Tax=Methanonatronarchaeum sp. AMET-Sl TaxID=3037654 RepID=UPI00244DD81B|nr:histidinol phosphate phosphatase domain-containing protein [Methanonatronarchaeum sp. AMET-Sl]WGI16772.1 histidinol phosphate phosphatase domain-containing protein [Methanonatronarchaeum sp. AMET-Sl]
MISDFHIHSVYSDGDLLPSEIAERYRVNGFDRIAITDHIDFSNLDVVEKLTKISKEIENIELVVGAELTFTPVDKIEKLAEKARSCGAEVIVMHGESPVEPVPDGTNIAAIESGLIDILAHPGYITDEVAEKAREQNVYLEITTRCGHCYTNGHVAKKAIEHNAPLIINSDAHHLKDLLTPKKAMKVGLGAGIPKKLVKEIIHENPDKLYSRKTTNKT